MLNPFIQKLESRFSLSDADKAALISASAHASHYAARRDIIREGDSPDHVHLIQSGFACRYKMLPNGTRSIVAYLIPGDICDLHGSILGAMDHSVATLSACDVVAIPRGTILDITSKYPTLNHALWWTVLVDEAILREWLVGMGRRSGAQHLAHIICELLVRLQAVGLADDSSYDLPLTQTDLGDTAGLSNVHVNRILQELRGKDLIVFKGGTLSIPDVKKLMAYAGFNPNYLHLSPKAVSLTAEEARV